MTKRESQQNVPVLVLPVQESAEEVLDNAPCGILTSLPDGTIVSVNQTFLTWTGFDREWLLRGNKFQDLLTVPGRIFYETHFCPLLHMQGFVNEIACHIARGASDSLPVLVNSNLKTDAAGRPLAIRTTVFRAIERTRYEQGLRQARSKSDQLAAIALSSKEAIFSTTVDGTILTWNPGAEAMLGYPASEAVGQQVSDLIFPPDRQTESAGLLQRLLCGDLPYFDTIRKRRDGTLVEVVLSISPIRNEHGTIIAISRILRDITERKQAEADLRGSEARYRGVVEGSLQGIVIQEHERIVYANLAMAEIFGYANPQELIGKSTFDDFVVAAERPLLRARTAAVKRGETVKSHPGWQGFRKDGSSVWISSMAHLSEWQGRPAIVSFYLDITERRQAEANLQSSEARFRSVVEGSLQGIVIQDNERVIYSNRAMAEMFGYSDPEELIGKSTIDELVAEEFRPLLRARTARVNRGEKVLPHPGWRGIRKDGSEIWLSATGHLTQWQGRPVVTSFYIDVTSRIAGERKLNEALVLTKMACVAGRMGTWHFDVATKRLNYSDEGLALLGIDRNRFDGTLEAIEAVVHPDDIARRRQAITAAIAETTLTTVEYEFRIIRPDGEVRCILLRGHVQRGGHSENLAGFGVILDITERKRAEEHQQMLTRELDHRVKNTLARVLVIMQRSTDGATTIDELMGAVEGRVQALAQAHSLLSQRNWRGAELTDLIKCELEPYATGANTIFGGPNVVLTPEATQAVTLVLHELATNAAKYGALSTEKGQVLVCWQRRSGAEARPELVIEWRETDGPPVRAPAHKGYGTSVITELIPYELGGTVDFELGPPGIFCRIVIPLARAEAAGA